jgi:hypothetical protein
LNRYDSSAVLRNKQTNLFTDDDNGSENNTKKGGTPPLPPTSSTSKTNKKTKNSKSKDENNVEDKKHKHHKISHEKREHAIDDEQEEKERQERRRKRREQKKLKEKNMQNEEEDFIESMKKLTTNNRRRRQESIGGGDGFEIDFKKKDEEEYLNNKLMPRKNSIVKIAFEQEAESIKPVESITQATKENHIDSEDEEEVKVDVGKQLNQNNIDNNSRIDQEYFKPLRKGSTIEFVLSPPPQGHVLNCKIIVNKGIFNEYLLYLEPNILIIKAHRRVASTKVYYVIDTINHEQDYYDKSKNCAKIISNMARNKFRMKLNSDMFTVHNNNILNIIFKSRGGEPRKVLADAFLCAGTVPTKDKLTYVLKNRQPQYDVEKKKFVLNFNGRASLSSKNNFQIVDESAPDNILMQLGKENTNRYNCDFAYPLCALQAFGFALGSLCK